jgi:hypothetical protein
MDSDADVNISDTEKLLGPSSSNPRSSVEFRDRHFLQEQNGIRQKLTMAVLIFLLLVTNSWWFLALSAAPHVNSPQEMRYCKVNSIRYGYRS